MYHYQVSALSRIAQGSQNADTNTAASSQTVSVKGSSLQVTVIQIAKIFLSLVYIMLITRKTQIAVFGEYFEVIG
jgi:hypothetical protein